jgi:hypothetical protein
VIWLRPPVPDLSVTSVAASIASSPPNGAPFGRNPPQADAFVVQPA